MKQISTFIVFVLLVVASIHQSEKMDEWVCKVFEYEKENL